MCPMPQQRPEDRRRWAAAGQTLQFFRVSRDLQEVVRSTPKPIQLPGRSNETLAAVIASPRGRVNVSWASLDISGNLSEETQNSTGR